VTRFNISPAPPAATRGRSRATGSTSSGRRRSGASAMCRSSTRRCAPSWAAMSSPRRSAGSPRGGLRSRPTKPARRSPAGWRMRESHARAARFTAGTASETLGTCTSGTR